MPGGNDAPEITTIRINDDKNDAVDHSDRNDPLFAIVLTFIDCSLRGSIKNQRGIRKIETPVTPVSLAFFLISFKKHFCKLRYSRSFVKIKIARRSYRDFMSSHAARVPDGSKITFSSLTLPLIARRMNFGICLIS